MGMFTCVCMEAREHLQRFSGFPPYCIRMWPLTNLTAVSSMHYLYISQFWDYRSHSGANSASVLVNKNLNSEAAFPGIVGVLHFALLEKASAAWGALFPLRP